MRFRTLSAVLISLGCIACSNSGDNTRQPAGQDINSAINTIARDSSEAASLTRRKCGSCHSLTRHIRKLGPSLKGVFNRKPSISGVPFAAWDEAALNAWLENPRAIKKNTRMALPGIRDAEKRKQIIEYLKLL